MVNSRDAALRYGTGASGRDRGAAVAQIGEEVCAMGDCIRCSVGWGLFLNALDIVWDYLMSGATDAQNYVMASDLQQ